MTLDIFFKGISCLSESFNRINHNEIRNLKQDAFQTIKHYFNNKRRCEYFIFRIIFEQLHPNLSGVVLILI